MHQSRLLKVVTLAGVLLLTGCIDEYRDWGFIQNVGGIAIGQVYKTDRGFSLPIRVDITGLQEITQKPRLVNSGLALKEIRFKRDGNQFLLALITTVPHNGYKNATSPDLNLGNLPPGRYSVFYLNPNGERILIGSFLAA